MTDFQKTLAAIGDLEQRSREEARRNAQREANPEPATPEVDGHAGARWLADRLQAHASHWTTFTTD
jgi:hypothetical protein